MRTIIVAVLFAGFSLGADDLIKLRDRQDRAGLEKAAAALHADAEKAAKDAARWIASATAYSYLAEVDYELRDKPASQHAAEAGISDAEKGISFNGGVADFHRVLGTLYGQVIPANPILGAISYGRKAKDALDRAMGMDPKSSKARVAHGVGYYYLPTNVGGGPDYAIKDYREAIRLDPNNAEAYLWLGIALARQHETAQAREAFTKSLQLDPDRVWAKQQLGKLPPK